MKLVKWLAAAALVACGIGTASADSRVSIAIGLPAPAYVQYDNHYRAPPPPVYRERVYYDPYYAPPPPPRVVYAPQPVYYGPPRTVVVRDVRYYHDHGDHRQCNHGRGRGNGRGRDWDDHHHHH